MRRRHPILRIEQHPRGPRVWVLDRRLHHGRLGLWLCCLGLALALHDWADAPWPTTDPHRP